MSEHETHIIPVEEASLHIESPSCSCKPEKVVVDSSEVIKGTFAEYYINKTVWFHLHLKDYELIDKLVQI